VLRRKPDDLDVRLYRASMRAQGGDKNGAIEDFEECLRRAPDDWHHRGNVERSIRQLREE
jgi:cytochrome c-type biogenesis protein CcmH/NrfG